MRLSLKFFLIFFYLFFINCFGTKFQKNDILPNEWTGESIKIASLGESYKRTHRFNKIFSKYNSKRFKPYYKFKDKKYKIIGTYKTTEQNYLVIEDKKGRLFKIIQQNNKGGKVEIPSFVVFDDILNKAKHLIGKKIWLNDIEDPEGFFTKSQNIFNPFQHVEVVDAIDFQNSDFGHPIWLKVIDQNREEAFVRYNIEGIKVGIKDNYFINDPLPIESGKVINDKIKNKKVEIGMSDRQVRIAIGYPDHINFTSSRHGLSEQWIYYKPNKKIYYQFEYGKLIYINY
jgi:outer membrane protein assembly factor BamE (lipoprotein component of BamABCDE complex)